MENKPIIVEYLIITKQEGTFCDSDKSFLKFLDVDSSISISEEENTITINLKNDKKFKVSYALISDLIPSQKERYFKLTLTSKEERLDDFTNLTKTLEQIIYKLNAEISINTLWNDIARRYAVQGYELINEVENLLRRLIANFMLVNVGYEWHKEHVPHSVESRGSYPKENYSDYLHQTFFSDLKTILFEGQRKPNLKNIGDIQILIQRHISDNKTNIPIEELKGVIATSLWEQHFAKDTDYKKKDLENDLESLNTLRNDIAHNRHISRETLGRIENLSRKVIKTLKLEIEDLPNKNLTKKQKEFQVNNEQERMINSSIYKESYIISKILKEWYEVKYRYANIVTELPLVGSINFHFDLYIHGGDVGSIGVEAKITSMNNLMPLGEKMILTYNKYLSKILDTFNEFHFVVILRNDVEDVKISSIDSLRKSLDKVNKKLKLKVGFINDIEKFEEL